MSEPWPTTCPESVCPIEPPWQHARPRAWPTVTRDGAGHHLVAGEGAVSYIPAGAPRLPDNPSDREPCVGLVSRIDLNEPESVRPVDSVRVDASLPRAPDPNAPPRSVQNALRSDFLNMLRPPWGPGKRPASRPRSARPHGAKPRPFGRALRQLA